MATDERKNLADLLDGYIDLDVGIVDVTLGGMAGRTRDIERDRRVLAGVLLGSLADDDGAMSAVQGALPALRDDSWAAGREAVREILAALDRYLTGEQAAG